jgi:hypothetical protein
MEQRTKTEITFAYPFVLGAIAKPFEPGAYVVTVDERRIECLSFAAFRKTATYLEVPAIGITNTKRQYLSRGSLQKVKAKIPFEGCCCSSCC